LIQDIGKKEKKYMNIVLVWLITMIIFLVGDIAWLSFIMKPYFVPRIAHLVHTNKYLNYTAALIAYVIITIGLTWFVGVPYMQASYNIIFMNGALFGFCIYGVYDLTNYALLNGWPLLLVFVDMMWGMIWCGLTSVMSIFIARYFLFKL
jgi:uncharacterized membrane protein